MILIRRGTSDRLLPPISLVLVGSAGAYVRGLTSYRMTDARDWLGEEDRGAGESVDAP